MTPPPPIFLADLTDADDTTVFGGKAGQLGVAARAGLPVPPGVALSWSFVDAVAAGQGEAVAALAAASSLGEYLAVRSSAIAEDSESASFAGQHESLLNVPVSELPGAVTAVRRSVHSAEARAYRERVGVGDQPRAGVLIQRMVDAEVAGVAFWPNPMSGSDEIVAEGAWGLGEAVAGGLVVPDMVRLSLRGEVLERRSGKKDRVVVPGDHGGTMEQAAAPDRAVAFCLDGGRLTALYELTQACRNLFGGPQDIEWAFAGGRIWLLQRRAATCGR